MSGVTHPDCSEWLSLFANRGEVAEAYADFLRTRPDDWPWWPEINGAILNRWSPSGLRYIKARAWQLVTAADREQDCM